MDEIELRAWVAKQLHMKSLPEPLWEKLRADCFVKEALSNEYDDALDGLLAAAKNLLQFSMDMAQRKPPPGRGAQRDFSSPWLNTQEKARAEVLAFYYASEAAGTPPVCRFRTTVLQEGLLSWQEAITFLSSPAPRFLSREQFETLGIPIVRHRSCIQEDRTAQTDQEKKTRKIALQIEWEEGTYIVITNFLRH